MNSISNFNCSPVVVGKKRKDEHDQQSLPSLLKIEQVKKLVGEHNISREPGNNTQPIQIRKGNKSQIYFIDKKAIENLGISQIRLSQLEDNLCCILKDLYSARKKHQAEIQYLINKGMDTSKINQWILNNANTFHERFLDCLQDTHPEIKTLRQKHVPLNTLSESVITGSLSQLSAKYCSDSEKSESISTEEIDSDETMSEKSDIDESLVESTLIGKIKGQFLLNEETATIGAFNRKITILTKDIDTLVRKLLSTSATKPKQLVLRDIDNKPVHFITYINTSDEHQVTLWNGTAIPAKEAPEYIGAGSFGVVQRVYQLVTGENAVLKSSKAPNAVEGSSSDVSAEGHSLRRIHANGNDASSIQGKPALIIERTAGLTDVNNSPIIGFIGPEYDGSVNSIMFGPNRPTDMQLLHCMEDVLTAVVALRKQGVSHGDIKGDNVFFKKQPDGSLKFFLADFGDCRTDTHWQRAGKNSVFTSSHFAVSDYKRRRTSLRSSQAGQWIEARDVFATGVMFCKWLTGNAPYPLQEVVTARYKDEARPDLKAEFSDANAGIIPDVLKSIKKRYGRGVASLLEKMLRPKFEVRITAQEALCDLTSILDLLHKKEEGGENVGSSEFEYGSDSEQVVLTDYLNQDSDEEKEDPAFESIVPAAPLLIQPSNEGVQESESEQAADTVYLYQPTDDDDLEIDVIEGTISPRDASDQETGTLRPEDDVTA